MTNKVPRLVLALTALSGCAGVYGELETTHLGSTTLKPDGGGAEMSAGAVTQVGFNVGIEFGSYKQRFLMGYTRGAVAGPGDATFSGASFRYDHNIFAPIDRLGLRLGAGFESGNSSSVNTAGTTSTDAGGDFLIGGGGTFFATWRTPIHAFVGYEIGTREVPAGGITGSGFTVRIGASLMAKDARGDIELVEALDTSRDLTGYIKDGADKDRHDRDARGRLPGWTPHRVLPDRRRHHGDVSPRGLEVALPEAVPVDRIGGRQHDVVAVVVDRHRAGTDAAGDAGRRARARDDAAAPSRDAAYRGSRSACARPYIASRTGADESVTSRSSFPGGHRPVTLPSPNPC